MEIKITTQTFPPKTGGMQVLMRSIAEGLVNLNYSVSVFPDHYYNKKSNFKIYNTISPKILRPWLKKINIYFKFKHTDIYICDSWKSIRTIPLGANKIICFAMAQEYLVRKSKENQIQKALDRCSYLVPISQYTLSLIKDRWKISEKKYKIINPTFSIFPKKITSKSINFPIVLFSICRIEKRKGLMQVAKSLNRIKHKIPDFLWHIAGTGPDEIELRKQIEKSKINKNVIFEGLVSDEKKDKLFQKTDLFVMPSYKDGNSVEGYGITYSEASSYGIPSLGGIEGGISDAIIHNQSGWCINPNINSQIDTILIESIKNHRKRLLFGSNAHNLFEKKQSSKIAFENLVTLF